jgi:uncharacterized protein YndB with AHSA1/START domain
MRIEAPPATVFRYLVDADRMSQWLGSSAVADARPGGDFRISLSNENVARGEFVEIVPNERVVWTWGWENSESVPPGSSTVEVTLAADGDSTVVTLRHTGLDEEQATRHTYGWNVCLDRLRSAEESVGA